MRPLAEPLGDLLRQALPREERFDAVVPVPLHWRRRWQRGFNQSELLARAIAKHCGFPVVNALERVKATLTQAGLSNTHRRRNVAAAFRCRKGGRAAFRVTGQRILLIDDVMTTGSTAASCATALKRAGAARVSLMTIARVDRRTGGGRSRSLPTNDGGDTPDAE